MDRVYLDDGSRSIRRARTGWTSASAGSSGASAWPSGTPRLRNDGKFRTPTVRNVDKRPGQGFPKAYMHNGAFKSLLEVVQFYNTRDVANWPPPEVDRNVNREIFEGVPLGDFQLDDPLDR
jgi:cytochrome c peroxidase